MHWQQHNDFSEYDSLQTNMSIQTDKKITIQANSYRLCMQEGTIHFPEQKPEKLLQKAIPNGHSKNIFFNESNSRNSTMQY